MTQSPKGWREIADVRLKYDLFLNYVAPSGLKIIFEGHYPPRRMATKASIRRVTRGQ
jgi:hypothetical protein